MNAEQATRSPNNEIVRANLGTCFMYVELAKSELQAGQRRLAERSFGMARIGAEALKRFLGKLEEKCQRDEVETKLVKLREKLDFLQGQLNPDLL